MTEINGRVWNKWLILDAIYHHFRLTGAPPKYTQWAKAGKNNPSAQTVVDHFGSWNAAIATAGFPTRRRRPCLSGLIGLADGESML